MSLLLLRKYIYLRATSTSAFIRITKSDISLLVVLLTILLALVVDKLAEVRSAEEEQLMETEKQEKQRKQRHDQINALKSPGVNVRRRTIRRLINFQAYNPAERVQMLNHGDIGNVGRQSSLPQRLKQTFVFPTVGFRRAASSPHSSMSSYGAGVGMNEKVLDNIEEEEVSEAEEKVASRARSLHGDTSSPFSGYSGVVQAAVTKKKNPLSFVRTPSGEDEHKRRRARRQYGSHEMPIAAVNFTARMEQRKRDRYKLMKKPAIEEELVSVALGERNQQELKQQRMGSGSFPNRSLKTAYMRSLDEMTEEARERILLAPRSSSLPINSLETSVSSIRHN